MCMGRVWRYTCLQFPVSKCCLPMIQSQPYTTLLVLMADLFFFWIIANSISSILLNINDQFFLVRCDSVDWVVLCTDIQIGAHKKSLGHTADRWQEMLKSKPLLCQQRLLLPLLQWGFCFLFLPLVRPAPCTQGHPRNEWIFSGNLCLSEI